MRIRPIMLAAALAVALGAVPLPSHAAGATVYSLNGKIQVGAKSNEGPKGWSLIASAARLTGAGPMMPKGARVEGKGILTLRTTPDTSGVGPAVATGIYTIRWSNSRTSKGVILCTISRVTLCELRNRAGYLKGSQAIITAQRNNNGGIAGALTLIAV